MSWISHEIHLAEAACIRCVADNVITPNQAKLEALVGTAPAGVEALITLVEKDDAKLGAIASAAINAVLENFKAQLEAEASALAAQGVAGIPALVQALHAVADKLAAN